MAAVGGVLLLGLLAFQVPRTMKMLNQSSASASDSSSSTVSVTVSGPIAAPSLSGGNATASATSVAAGGLSDPSEVCDGQLRPAPRVQPFPHQGSPSPSRIDVGLRVRQHRREHFERLRVGLGLEALDGIDVAALGQRVDLRAAGRRPRPLRPRRRRRRP